MGLQPRTGVLAVALALAAAPAGCAQPGTRTAAESAGPAISSPSAPSSQPARSSQRAEVTDSNGMRPGVFPSTRVEPPTDADRPDGPPPKPDANLTAGELTALITVPASVESSATSCVPDQVRLWLTGIDAAAGHRFARLTATNISGRTCVLIGWPGLGLRGGWGTAFPNIAERSTAQINRVGVPEPDPAIAVTLVAGGRAAAEFEWTGALGGVRDERVSLIVVQLTAGDSPAALPIDPADQVDVGPETTVRISPWGKTG